MNYDRWMPLYIGDYLADTIGLSDEQHGRYLMAIMSYWRKHGPLTEAELKRVLKSDFDLISLYFKADKGRYRHTRIDRELASTDELRERNKARTEAATLARKQRNDERDDNVTSTLRPPPLPLPVPYDKAYKGKATKAKKLSHSQRALAKAFEDALNSEWVNDAGKWVNRIKTNFGKSNRVVAELQSAMKEGRVKTSPAAYAEHIWKEFA